MDQTRNTHEDTGWPGEDTSGYSDSSGAPAPDALAAQIAEATAAAARVAQARRDAEAAAALPTLQEQAARRQAEQLAAQRAENFAAVDQAREAIATARLTYPAWTAEMSAHQMAIRRMYAGAVAMQAPLWAAWKRYEASGGTRSGWETLGGHSPELFLMEHRLKGDFSNQDQADHTQYLNRLGVISRNSF